jgi:molecular chaperone DnaJ
VAVPAGIDDNSSLRLTGQGEASPDGGPSGNVYVRIDVAPHELFTRRDRNILHTIRVNVAQAALGDELEVEPSTARSPSGCRRARRAGSSSA